MAELVDASGTVHWVGAGLSTGLGLREVCDRAGRVVLWSRRVERAAGVLARLGLTGRAEARAYDRWALPADLGPGDVVVSMVPAAEHAPLLRACVDRRAHFACSSYVSADLLAEAPAAASAGLVVLTEAGLDPGIDHLYAHALVDRARTALGEMAATADFTSYCGGLPAVPNEFRYRFSWAPRGVLGALRAPARYVAEGAERVADRPWEATRAVTLAGETFEAYPNRDSLPFVEQYGLPLSWRLRTFVRGTLRLEGWREAWAPVFAAVETGDDDRIAALADDLAARYPTTDTDRDRVVLAVALRVRGDRVRGDGDGPTWSGAWLLDIVGDDADSAMARCVSLPLAVGVAGILAGDTAPGLHRAAEDAATAGRWLDFLAAHGVAARLTEGHHD